MTAVMRTEGKVHPVQSSEPAGNIHKGMQLPQIFIDDDEEDETQSGTPLLAATNEFFLGEESITCNSNQKVVVGRWCHRNILRF